MTEGVLRDSRAFRAKEIALCGLGAFVCLVLVNLRLVYFKRELTGIESITHLSRCFVDFSMIQLAEGAIIFAIFWFLRKHRYVPSLAYVIPSLFFAFFMVEGRCFETTGGVDFFGKEKFFLLQCALACLGYFFVYMALFSCVDYFMCSCAQRRSKQQRSLPRPVSTLLRLLEWHPFITSLVFLLIASTPILVAMFPGFVSVDSTRQMAQAYSISSYTPHVHLVNENVKIFNQHSVLHTLFIYFCLNVGTSIFGSWNAGIVVYAVIQVLISLCSYAYCVATLVRHTTVRTSSCALVLLFFALHPHVQSYLSFVTKDVIYASFLLFAISISYQILTGVEVKRCTIAWWLISLAGVVLFRKDGIFLAAPMMAAMTLVPHRHKWGAVGLATVLAVAALWQFVMLPAIGVSPGSRRAMFSVPFQQTTRYIIEYPDDVTPEEKKAIAAILPYERLAELYNPDISDPVNFHFNEDATSEDVSRYVSTWKEMYFKHPDAYWHSTLEFKYQFFYPSKRLGFLYTMEQGANMATQANTFLEELGTDFELEPRFDGYRMVFGAVRDTIFRLPIINLSVSSFFYFFFLAFLLFFCLRHWLYQVLVLIVPLLFQMALIVVGPCNGYYFRYTYPIALCLSAIFVMASAQYEIRRKAGSTQETEDVAKGASSARFEAGESVVSEAARTDAPISMEAEIPRIVEAQEPLASEGKIPIPPSS